MRITTTTTTHPGAKRAAARGDGVSSSCSGQRTSLRRRARLLLLIAPAFVLSPTSGDGARAQTTAAITESNVSGTVVDSRTGAPLPLVTVTAYEENYTTRIGSTISDLRGQFILEAPFDDEIALHINGTLVLHERGWQACDNNVVPTIAEACTTAPGPQGTITLDLGI